MNRIFSFSKCKNDLKPILSICIPCYKRINQVRNTLTSIYETNVEVSLVDYEVILSDNDPEREIEVLMDEFADKPNLFYYHTECEGFLNSYHVLTYAKGELLKLHNSQNLFRKGALRHLLDEIIQENTNKTLMFHTNGFLGNKTICKYDNFNDFMSALSYWSSWSGGFSIWKEDFDAIGKIELNELFPHTSVFLTQYAAQSFLIDDTPIYNVQRIAKRGGHNKFKAFTIDYPSLIMDSYMKGHISLNCKNSILKDICTQYLPTLLFNKYIVRIETFDATGYRENIKRYFSEYAYWVAWINVIFVPFRMIGRKCIRFWNTSLKQE
ncbi:glycosyltransferase [Phocaeicola sp.]